MSELKGTFQKALPLETGVSKAGKDFTKLTFLVETPGQYSRTAAFTLFGDKCDIVMPCAAGDQVTVSFDPESREWNGKYFTENKCYKLVIDAKVMRPQAPVAPPVFPPPNSAPIEDDLPF